MNNMCDTFDKEYCLKSESKSFRTMLSYCKKVANSSANILITGESGTGKEIAAQYIHYMSKRKNNNFVAVNCSAYTENLLESELFGYEQGAFTGAIKSKPGKIELADSGTLFLDEIGDISMSTQLKLLRTIENKIVERVGRNKEKYIDFRLISATNRDLVQAVTNNIFRDDFFYRINTIVISIPPLRERMEDLPELINFFLQKSQHENNIHIKDIVPKVNNFLYSYDYPGNIRELKGIIERMVILSDNGVITEDGLPIMYSVKSKHDNITNLEYNSIIPIKEFNKISEANYLRWVLEKTNGNVTEASRKLEISSRQLFNKIKEYKLK